MPLHKWIKDQLACIRTVSRPSLPVTVKREIHQLLRSDWLSNLRYGDRTLQRHDMLHYFDWSSSRYRYGCVGNILICHIATTVYQQLAASSKSKAPENEKKLDGSSREVATTLSNVTSQPAFLFAGILHIWSSLR